MRKKTYLKLVEYQTEQSEKHLNEVRSIHKEMRGYKHDFHHHLQTLKGQLEAGEVDRALAYIEQLDNQLMNVDTLLKTGNVSLDAILSAKIAQAKAENIAVTVKANVPDTLTISDLELSIVVGNLLDNAIEACRKVTENPYVTLKLKYDRNSLLICVENNYSEPLNIINNKIHTTKSDTTIHGIGLKSVAAVAKKYDGKPNYSYDNNIFKATVFIYANEA